MADVLISNLPTYTASTVTGTYFIINNSGNTTTFKATREQFVPLSFGTGTCSAFGGCSNSVAGNCSSILGGKGNTITSLGTYSFIGAGTGNTVSCNTSSIVGGSGNTASGIYSFIGTGRQNIASGAASAILAGQYNCATGSFSTVVQGGLNCVSGAFSAILGGCGNNVTGNCSGAFGASITASADNTFYVNNLCATANVYTPAVNTNGITISSFTSGCAVCVGLGGSFCPYTPSGGGGGSSPYCYNTGAASSIIPVLGTNQNCGSCSSIVGGAGNNIDLTSANAFIGAGCYNCVSCSSNSSVVGGGAWFCGNKVLGSSCSFVGGGLNNCIYGTYSNTYNGFNVINGGSCNNIICNVGSVIGGGMTNNINGCYGNPFNVIGGGVGNNTCGGCWTYSNCWCNLYPPPSAPNLSNACYTFIGGGWQNMNNHMYGVIGGGSCNILACASFSYPAGSVIAGGVGNGTTGGSWSAFGGQGGWSFCPSACNLGCFSSIGGGFQNNTTGCYGTIPGGKGNTISGNYSGGVGCFLIGAADCTFYVNNLCVCGTLSKMSGSFKIPHPDPNKTTKFLQHSFVESPTAGENIYRYSITTTNCSASVELPDYYKFLNENDQVFITPKNHFGSAYGIVNQEQTCVSFCSNCDGEYNVLVIGTRKDKEATNYWKGTEVEEVQQ